MYCKNIKLKIAGIMLAVLTLLFVIIQVGGRHRSHISDGRPIIFIEELATSGIQKHEYIFAVSDINTDDKHDVTSIKAGIVHNDKRHLLEMSLEKNSEVAWNQIIARFADELLYEVGATRDYIVVDVYVEHAQDQDRFQKVYLLPEIGRWSDLCINTSFNTLNSWAHGITPIASVIMNMAGNILDIRYTGISKLSDKCIVVNDAVLCNENMRIWIGSKIDDLGSDQDSAIDLDRLTNQNNKFSSTQYLNVAGIHIIDKENIIVGLIFQDKLFYRNDHLYTWRPPRDFLGVNSIVERCLAIILMDSKFNIKWDSYLGPIHFGSESTPAFTHFTIDGNLYILFSYRHQPIYVNNNGDNRMVFHLDTPSGIGSDEPNVYQAIACITKTGKIEYVRQLAKGFLRPQTLLKISDDTLYLHAHSGSSLAFASACQTPVSIQRDKSFSCILKLTE